MRQLPLYICHKQVRAAKIAEIVANPGNSLTLRLEGEHEPYEISAEDRMHRPEPSAGWYLVLYENGYFSFSPAEAFEEGYSLAPVQI